MPKLGINFDEISDNLTIALEVMRRNHIDCGELRTVNGKNFVFWSDKEVEDFKKTINETGIELVAAATPLFKWYIKPNDLEVIHDSFGFSPRLSDQEKRQVIKRAVEIAKELGIPRLRIFSGLGTIANSGRTFAKDDFLAFALDQVRGADIKLYLENEPVCRVHTKADIVELFSNNQSSQLRFWLDIANLVELGEVIDDEFLAAIGSRIGYLHIKDYVTQNGQRSYVPAGEGQVDYRSLLPRILAASPDDVVVTIETHAPSALKVEYSERAIDGVRELFSSVGKVA